MSVVVGIDDSPVAPEVLARAIEQARWRGTDLHVVHVFHLPIVYTEAAINWAEVAEAQRSAVWAAADEALDIDDVEVERVDLEGYPPDVLVDYASQVDAELLVVGTRGRGEIASLILGSTSHRAIHLAGCDVLVVKAPTEG
ncbi:MAG TPA: universal stress protein [Acidimicrobiia bacterium]|nr:universal stress protein [Acidimicrobiia bacterium]